MNFWRRFKFAWHYCKSFPDTTTPANYWTNIDARALSNFLTSDSGTKLRHLWVEKMNRACERAIMEQAHPKYYAGLAWGVRGMIIWIDSLLFLSPSARELQTDEHELGGVFRSVNR